uniref:Anaphase-promoting complex subunit 13 n=1 Tax=Phallusia mammillata TaxID=59560 RepID=A0A6F9D732_9ASCI|nr:anaphase-promoting complex subunit 13-like [Phallusia mammillata]
MDGEAKIEGHLIDILDEDWVSDKLPLEDIDVPLEELPDIEQDNGNTKETMKELEKKWNDDNLQSLLHQTNHRQS